MPRYVALLRGVNVGGSHKAPMADVRRLFESLGYGDVVTYIQSGNVVFTASEKVAADEIEFAFAGMFGFESTVVLRTAAEMAKVIAANPFPKAEPAKLHVGFMERKPAAAVVNAVDATSFLPEAFAVVGRELYLHLPNGMGTSKLPVYLDRRLKVPTTIRNWNSVSRILELATAR